MAHNLVSVLSCDLCERKLEGVKNLPEDWAKLRIPYPALVKVSRGRGRASKEERRFVPKNCDVCPNCRANIAHAVGACLPEELRAKLSEEMLRS